MIIKREWLDLHDLLKNKSKMDKMNPLLRKQIFDFCRDSNNLHRKEEKIKRLQNLIKNDQIKMRNISKKITGEYHYIKNELSIGRSPVYILCEMKGKSYRLDINYRGSRRKLTLGNSLSVLNKFCKTHNNRFDERINESNWKLLVKKYLQNYISEKVTSLTKDEFELSGKIIIEKKSLEVVFTKRKHETDKKRGKTSKGPSSQDYSKITRHTGKGKSGSGEIKYGGNSGWNRKFPNVDDTPDRFKNRWKTKSPLFDDETKNESIFKKLMYKQKMGGKKKS